jgi:antitoxin component YwqK of YwqJK toxin-antitoxin module
LKILSLLLFVLCFSSQSFAQAKKNAKASNNQIKTNTDANKKKPNAEPLKVLPSRPDSVKPYELADNGDTINVTDKNNMRQGVWIIKSGGDFGEFVQYEMGKYINGKKYGRWRTYETGSLIKEENYFNNCLSGEAKYFEEGRLVAKANFYSSKKANDKDTILVKNPVTGAEKMVVIATENTSYRDGEWQYFYLNGKLKRAEWYVLDELVDARDYPEVEIDSTQALKFPKLSNTATGYQQFDQNNQSHTRFTNFQFVKPPMNGGFIRRR